MERTAPARVFLLLPLLLLAALPRVDHAGTPPPPPKEAAPAQAALDWDRDFDLILESRQGKGREYSVRNSKLEALRSRKKQLEDEEADLRARLEIVASNVTGEEAFNEMVRLEVNTPDRARAILESKLAEIRNRIQDVDEEIRRALRGKR
jgi:hypothetical protein